MLEACPFQEHICFVYVFFPPTAESFGVSAQIGSGVVRGGPEVRFHEGSTRVPPGFHEVLRGLRGGASTKKSTACCWGYHLSLFCFVFKKKSKKPGRGSISIWRQSLIPVWDDFCNANVFFWGTNTIHGLLCNGSCPH